MSESNDCKFGQAHCDYFSEDKKKPTPVDCLACCVLWAGIRVYQGLEKVAKSIEEKI